MFTPLMEIGDQKLSHENYELLDYLRESMLTLIDLTNDIQFECLFNRKMAWGLKILLEVIDCKEIADSLEKREKSNAAYAEIWKIILNLCQSNLKQVAEINIGKEIEAKVTSEWDQLNQQTLPNQLLTILALHELATTNGATLQNQARGCLFPSNSYEIKPLSELVDLC